MEPMEGLKILPVELSHRFETFTIAIHDLIEEEGKDAFCVFDCLSELEEAWATDLMTGDFFHLTCPYLFSLDERLKPIYAVGNGEHVCQDFSL